mgnify:FL=1
MIVSATITATDSAASQYCPGHSHRLAVDLKVFADHPGPKLSRDRRLIPIILPLKYSANWITFTREGLTLLADAFMLDITVDQRIINAHPDQIADFPPWDHRFAGTPPIEELPDFAAARPVIDHFESARTASASTRIGHQIYRFAMGDHLPRPAWAGTGRARMLGQGESVAGSFLLAHDCYLTL